MDCAISGKVFVRSTGTKKITEDLAALPPTPRGAGQAFTVGQGGAGFKLGDFWQWMGSSLLDNTVRGLLAEYIVAQALSAVSRVRVEWDEFDVQTSRGIKVEVKSAAYIQSWKQKRHSAIRFGIAPTRGLDSTSGAYSGEKRRSADVYVFCLLAHKDQATVAPLNLDQWEFMVISTAKLDALVPTQKTIGLKPLLALEPRVVAFGEIEAEVLAEAEMTGPA